MPKTDCGFFIVMGPTIFDSNPNTATTERETDEREDFWVNKPMIHRRLGPL